MDTRTLTPGTLLQTDTLQVEHREIVLGDHARLDLTTAKSTNGPTRLERVFQNPDRMVGLHYCLNGKSILTQGNLVAGARLNDETCHLMLALPNRTDQIMKFEGNFSLASFFIDLNHFAALLGTDFERLHPIFVRSAGLGDKCSCTVFRWTPGAYAAISQLLHARFSGAASRIFLESKMLELVALMLDAQNDAPKQPAVLRPSDAEKIRCAKDLLLADLANPPSLAQLARLVGTNEFVLKKGFRELFGMPVFQFLYQRRMVHAWEILQNDRTKSVAEVGFEVGYDDHSAFTRAFANCFGLRPSEVRR